MVYDAILSKYFIVRHAGLDLIYGTITGDKKGRFEDGADVRTSAVIDYAYEGTDKYAITRNSVYKLEEPLQKD